MPTTDLDPNRHRLIRFAASHATLWALIRHVGELAPRMWDDPARLEDVLRRLSGMAGELVPEASWVRLNTD